MRWMQWKYEVDEEMTEDHSVESIAPLWCVNKMLPLPETDAQFI